MGSYVSTNPDSTDEERFHEKWDPILNQRAKPVDQPAPEGDGLSMESDGSAGQVGGSKARGSRREAADK